jgi:ferredoxin
MKVRLDRELCSGHAMCNVNGPNMYPLDDLGYNAIDGEIEVPDGLAEEARRGADACPERAITIVEGR